jgi:hypothetical protein
MHLLVEKLKMNVTMHGEHNVKLIFAPYWESADVA